MENYTASHPGKPDYIRYWLYESQSIIMWNGMSYTKKTFERSSNCQFDYQMISRENWV